MNADANTGIVIVVAVVAIIIGSQFVNNTASGVNDATSNVGNGLGSGLSNAGTGVGVGAAIGIPLAALLIFL